MNHHHKTILPLLFLTLHLAGATPPDTLKTGDKIPAAFTFQQILNQGEPPRADALTGRHLILQFWSTTCNASIRLLTQMKDIHAKYGDRIRVLPVTFDPEEKVTATLRGYPALQDLDLPMAVNERQLHALFPHITIPHIVIADPDLKVLAVTGAQDLTEDNIEKLLAGQQPAFRPKEDVRIPFLHKEKFISENRQIPHKNIRFQSSLSAYIPGVSGALVVSDDFGGHIMAINTPVLKLFRTAYSANDLPNYFGNNRIDLEGFGPDDLNTGKTGLDYLQWMEEGDHVFSYELITPPGKDKFALMREDLKRYFPHIEAHIKNRKRTIWAMVKTGTRDFPPSTGAKTHYDVGPMGIKVTNSQLQGFVYYLNLYFMQGSPYPVMDRTGIDYPIDFEVDARLSDLESLRGGLQRIGLDLELREEEIPVLVLKKKFTENQSQP